MAFSDLIPWTRPRAVTQGFAEERDPFFALQRSMNRLLDDFTRGFPGFPATNSWGANFPHVELSETGTEVKVVAELPGLDQKDVDVSLNDGILTIKGEKARETENPAYTERWHGSFSRAFQVGAGVDPEKVAATFKNGVLTITLGKRAEAQAQVKRIPIATA
jgi:HSP20 family protein